MRGDAKAVPAPKQLGSDFGAANVAVEVDLAATSGVSHVLHRIDYSYSAAPSGTVGALTIYVDEVAQFGINIIAGGEGCIDFGEKDGLPFGIGERVRVELGAGGSGIYGNVNVVYR